MEINCPLCTGDGCTYCNDTGKIEKPKTVYDYLQICIDGYYKILDNGGNDGSPDQFLVLFGHDLHVAKEIYNR